MNYQQPIIKSFLCAIKGLKTLFKHERNAKIHLTATLLVFVAGLLFHLTPYEWLAIFIVVGLVISFEAINTSIEQLADLLYPEHNVMIGKIKDTSAGAVLCAAIVAILIGGIIFLPKVVTILRQFE